MLALLLLGAQAGCFAQPLPAPECRLQSSELDELSGLVASTDGRYFWGLNDSGGAPRLFRVGACGEDLGQVEVEGVRNRDWEDLAYMVEDGEPLLLIADIGDNMARRAQLGIIAVPEPAVDQTRVVPRWQQRFAFPQGPRDAEALAVDPLTGEVLLLSKREDPPRLFRIPRGGARSVAAELGEVGTIRTTLTRNWLRGMVYQLFGSMPTAMDISRHGERLAVLTLTELFVWTRTPGQPWIEVMNREPMHFVVPASLEQAEAVAFTADGSAILLSSEKPGAPVVRIELQPLRGGGARRAVKIRRFLPGFPRS